MFKLLNRQSREQREILALQADLLRLRLEADRLRMARHRQRQKQQEGELGEIMRLAGEVSSNGLAWKAMMMPARWKHRLLLGGVYMAWRYWQGQRRR